MKTTVSTLLLAFALGGCAVSVGPGEGAQKISDASQESLQKQFEVGVATRNDVALQLGAPTVKTVAGDFEIWNYRYTKRAAVGVVFVGIPVGSIKTASFYFDNGTGVLKKIEFESHQG
jgi:outer membrane protein assembly factor BamE (lipoprotein component of BamABCDE complex)